MDLRRYAPSDHAIELHILGLLRSHRRLTFLSMAEAAPQYTWRELLDALNRLNRKGRVSLTPMQWDYEVTLATRP